MALFNVGIAGLGVARTRLNVLANLHVRPKFANFSINVFARSRVNAQFAVGTFAVGGNFRTAHFGYFFVKSLVKAVNHFLPRQFSVGDVVKFFFDVYRKRKINHVGKQFDQKIIDNYARVCRKQLGFLRAKHFLAHRFFDLVVFQNHFSDFSLLAWAVFFDNVLAADNRRDGWRVGRRPTNAHFFQFLYQTGLGVARRRARKPLDAFEVVQINDLPHVERWQHSFGIFFFVVF